MLACAILLLAIGSATAAPRAKYVFLFIGDGTSVPQRNTAEFFLASKNSPKEVEAMAQRAQGKIGLGDGIADFKPSVTRLLMNTLPSQGMSTTYSVNSLITDSSSSGTAIATGRKTQDGVVGMDPLGKEKFTSMAKMAKKKGMKVGIVSSVSIEHATPASFYANSPSRNLYYNIALQLPESGFNYFGGGGFVQPTGPKKDQRNIFEILKEKGYKSSNTRTAFDKLKKGDDKIVAINPVLDRSAALPYAMDQKPGEISLAEFTAKGIELLENPDGFFMMVEGGKVDWACHANDAVATINDVIALDEAVKVAYDFYEKHPKDTLIVVTGDHETGGLVLGFAGTRYDTFLTKLHNQKGSYEAFDAKFADFKKQNPKAKFEDVLPLVADFFGMKAYSKEEMALLDELAKKGDSKSVMKLSMAFKPHELENLKQAFAMSMKEKADRPANEETFYLAYGTYEPLTVTLTHILNQKAGIGWTTFSHSGLPTPVSAIGVGHTKFGGNYDNTDIFKKIVSIAQY